MALLAVLLVLAALAGWGGFALVRRGRALEPDSVAKALTAAAAKASAGQQEQARRRYAALVDRLAVAPPPLRPHRGLALLGQAAATAALGDAAGALPHYREAFPLLAEPARQLPRWVLRQLAEERMQAPDGDLAPVLAFLRATAAGAEPGVEAESASRSLAWLQRLCREGATDRREHVTVAARAALPERDWPVLARVALLREGGRAAEAEALLATAAPAGGSELWFRLGALLSTPGRHAQAVEAFGEALRRGPGEASPWARGAALRAESLLFRGLARQFLLDVAGAAADFRAAADEAPADPRPRYALGRLALLHHADDEAADRFTAALAASPSYAPARLGLALLHERAGRPAEAAEQYRAGLDGLPQWRPARVRLGAALLAAGRPAEAEPLLRAEAGTGSHWERGAAFHHGLALARADDPAGALERWEPLRDADLTGRLALVRDRLARLRLAADPAAARALWQQAVADAPDVPGYRLALREAALREAAHLLLTARDLPDARAAAAEALALAGSLAAPPTGAEPADTEPTDAPPTGAGPAAPPVRERRLRAAIALAAGSAEGQAGLLDQADGPRDRYHLAAGALLTGRAVQTVTLLAPVEPDPAGDPALSRLRALLAERAGNWPAALEWHRSFLDAPGTGPAAPGGARCGAGAADCTEPAVDACAGCGREGCAAHLYRPASAASARCAGCAGPALRAVLGCARRAGLVPEAERILTAWAEVLGDGAAAVPVRRDLALLRAEAGELDAALALMPTAAPRARSAVLVRRAAAALDAQDAGRAVADLREAVGLTPEDPHAGRALGTLAEHEALHHAGEGRHREAWDGYHALLLADPGHPRLLHSLGLVSYRLAVACEAAGPSGGEDAARYWPWAIGCLVSALHLPDLWDRTASVTGRPIEAPRIAAARTALTDRLRGDLRELDQARGLSGDDVDAWTVRLGMETRSAEAFAQQELHVARDGGAGRRLVLGPALGRLLHEESRGVSHAGPLVAWAGDFDYAVRPWRRPGPFGVHPLTEALGLFDALGPHRYLLLQGRHAAAVAALDAVPEAERDEAWHTLLREALTSQAREHHRHQDWREALAVLDRLRALPGGEVPAELAELAADSGLRAARALLKESDDDQSGAVELLERALAVAPDHAEVRSNLGAAYAQLARKINNESTDYSSALVLLRKALKLAPTDPTARHFLQAALGNRANELTKPGSEKDLREAAALWQELVDLDADPEHRLGLAYAMRLLARAAALADDRAAAVERMTAALRADPEWTGDTAREAPRRVSVLLANHVLDDLQDRPFAERSAMLRQAQTYDDSSELRRVMVSVWRSEAAKDYNARRYADALSLLEQALAMCESAEDTAAIRNELGIVLSSQAVGHANTRQFRQARVLIAKAVEYSPNDRELRALQRRINSLR
ncbi:hypothetical protein [Kitasatospora sp. NPDC088346]|uniref:hypothetical protein n=1 Tax=Kitasatospora sp. NPDC088346 TaxID=3364073 RepID=UPI00381EA4A7